MNPSRKARPDASRSVPGGLIHKAIRSPSKPVFPGTAWQACPRSADTQRPEQPELRSHETSSACLRESPCRRGPVRVCEFGATPSRSTRSRSPSSCLGRVSAQSGYPLGATQRRRISVGPSWWARVPRSSEPLRSPSRREVFANSRTLRNSHSSMRAAAHRQDLLLIGLAVEDFLDAVLE